MNDIRPEVLTYDDIAQMAPRLKGHKKLVDSILHFLSIDRVNQVHARWCSQPGIPFSTALVEKEFKINLRLDGAEVLDRFQTGPFITVSNHPFGAMDGIMLTHIVGSRRPDYKVMVNEFLNHITAMRPGFIAVDALQSDDPARRAISTQGIRQAIQHVRAGHPLGFFPAGAVSKIQPNLRIQDRQWQPSVIRLIQQLKVPVVPIYFHGHNSLWFNILGLISWQLRTLRLPAEVFRTTGQTKHVSIGPVITPDQIAAHPDLDDLSRYLRTQTYNLRHLQPKTP